MQPNNALAAIKEAVRTLKAAVEWCVQAVLTRIADIEPVAAQTVEDDYLVEHGGP